MGLKAHEVKCLNLGNDEETTIAALAGGKLVVLGALPSLPHHSRYTAVIQPLCAASSLPHR
eukprot:COSAG02_NODE_1569_length_11894_cov_51.145994_3_plen_61_part_00